MVKTKLHEIFQLIKLNTFINTEYKSLVSIVVGELYGGLDSVQWWTLQFRGVSKEVDGDGISNSNGGGKF